MGRVYLNPKYFSKPKKIKILKPEPDKTRLLKKFQNPKEKIIENVQF